MNVLVLSLLVVSAAVCSAEVTVLEFVQTIYNRYPSVIVRGAGFDADAKDILLEVSAPGQPSLRTGKEFWISKEEDGIVLKLKNGQR